MKERVDRRALGAVRWLDAITQRAIATPLVVQAPELRFARNQSGHSIIVAARGLEAYERAFNLADLPGDQQVADGSKNFDGFVSDPSGEYLPRKFTVKLPRVATPPRNPDGTRPANSLFVPIEIALLPSPLAYVAASWAQIRISARDGGGEPLRNLYVRVVATTGGEVIGRGMTDARGEGLIIVAGLKLFAPGPTPDEVTTSKTEVRLEAIPPAGGETMVDWTELDAQTATAPNKFTLQIQAGKTFAIQFPFT